MKALLGGLALSTAVTPGFAERSRTEKDLDRSLGLAVMVAWAPMFSRVLVAVAALSSSPL